MSLGRRFQMTKQFIVALARFVAFFASLGYLVYIVLMIYVFAPGALTLERDLFNLILALCLFLLAVLIQRRDSKLGRFLSSR